MDRSTNKQPEPSDFKELFDALEHGDPEAPHLNDGEPKKGNTTVKRALTPEVQAALAADRAGAEKRRAQAEPPVAHGIFARAVGILGDVLKALRPRR